MATIRVEKRKDFTVLSNACLDDERLSLRAVGLLNYMLRQPDDWNFTLEWLAGKHKDGLCAIRSAMEELEAAGYVTRGQSRQGGKFSKNEYIVRESPVPSPSCENRITAPPSCDFPITEKPITENRTLPNTKRPSTEPPYSPPEGDGPAAPAPAKEPKKRRRPGKLACDWQPDIFERFWKLYPRGDDKTGARYEWDLLKPDLELMQRMSSALKRQIASKDWQKGVGIPWASRWLRERRWEWIDDIEEKSSASRSGPNTAGEEALPWI